MSSREFSRWMAYDVVAPFGPERDDLRAGGISATIANVNRNPERRPEPFMASDFVLRFKPEEPEPEEEAAMSDEETHANSMRLLAWVEQFNAVIGGRDERPTASA